MPERILDNITVIECATFVGAPPRCDNWMREQSQPPRLVGEHGGEVLRELGYSDDDITALRSEMVTNAAS